MTPRTFRKAAYPALASSVGGLALVCSCIPFVGPRDTLRLATEYWPQIAAGYGAMIALIEVAGVPLRSKLTQFRAGGLFALLLFLAGATAGSATSMIIYHTSDAHGYIFKPVFWLALFGFIPAILIGVAGTGLLRRVHLRDEAVARTEA